MNAKLVCGQKIRDLGEVLEEHRVGDYLHVLVKISNPEVLQQAKEYWKQEYPESDFDYVKLGYELWFAECPPNTGTWHDCELRVENGRQ